MNKYFRNQKELLTVASIIFAEVEWDDHPFKRMRAIRAILKVGINRLNKPKRFKCNSLYEVFTAPKQFSCYPESNQFKKAQNGLITDNKEFEIWREIVNELIILRHSDFVLPEITSNHYYNPKLCSPSWAQGVPVDLQIGGHNFLTL